MIKDWLYLIISDFISLNEINISKLIIINNKDEDYIINTKINYTNIMINLIVQYGDKKTLKNNSFFSAYNKNLIDIIFKNIENIYCPLLNEEIFKINNNLEIISLENKIFSLGILNFRLINKLIEYSSDDFQDYIEDVLKYQIITLKNLNFFLINLSNNRNLNDFQEILLIDNIKQILFDFQKNIISTINIVYVKINRIVDEEISLNFLELIIQNFEIRNKPNLVEIKCLGLLALSNNLLYFNLIVRFEE